MTPPRPKLSVKTGAPARDPRRRSVRPGAPRPPAGAEPPPHGGPAKPPARGSGAPPKHKPSAPPPFGERRTRDERRPAAPYQPQQPAPRPGPGAAPTRPAPGPAAPRPPRVERATAPLAAGTPRVARDPASEGIRLSKQLSDQGLASRREADDWIAAGWVRVDGKLAVLGQRVLPHQRIDIDPAARGHQSQQVTVLLHKPIGFVSGQAEDGYQPASVLVTPANHWSGDASRIAFNPGHLRGLAPAGRLDIDSTGLLVLTQDGRIARHLIGEDSRVEKEYLVRVAPVAEGAVRDDALALLNHGLELDGKPLKPAKVSWQNEEQLRFVLREGRKRQIRRMCELVGFKVLGLKRIRIGSVVLGPLPPGQWRYLGVHERF